MNNFAKIFFAAIFLLAISSCDRKTCKDGCPSNETCYNGSCLCPDGYEGVYCDSLSYLKYSGSWQATETTCGGAPPNFNGAYTVTIFQAGGSYSVNTVVLSNFLSSGNLYAYIQNTSPQTLGNTLYIPAQSLGNGVSISNSYGTFYPAGSASGVSEILINLNYTYQGNGFQCQETMYLM